MNGDNRIPNNKPNLQNNIYSQNNSNMEQLDKLYNQSMRKQRFGKIKKRIAIAFLALTVTAGIATPVVMHIMKNRYYEVSISSSADNFKSYKITLKRGADISKLRTKLNMFEGHTLTGIYKDEQCTIAFEDGEKVSKNATIYLKYEKNKYSITMPTSPNFDVWTSQDASAVEWGDRFTFKVNLKPGYTNSNITVRVGETTLTPNANGLYEIYPVRNNYVVTVDGVEYNTYSIGTIPDNVTVTNESGAILHSGVKVNEGDELTISYTETAGWQKTVFTVNGEEFENGGTILVTSNLNIVYDERQIEYRISYQEKTGCDLKILVNGEELTGDIIYYDDIIQITTELEDMYELASFEVTGAELRPDGKYKVRGDVEIKYEVNKLEVLTLVVDGVSEQYDVVEGTSIASAITANTAYTGENTCGWYMDHSLSTLPNADLTINSATTLYTRKATNSSLKFTPLGDGSGYKVKMRDKEITGEIVIPQYYNGLPVTTIAEDGFKLSAITAVTIPNTVANIQSGAFDGCTILKNVTFASNSNLLAIDDKVFMNCTGLTTLTIPKSVTSINEQAFYQCLALNSITIPQGVTSIHPRAFNYCTNLAEMKVESGNTKYYSQNNAIIEKETKTLVVGCNETEIPNDVETIGIKAFQGSDVADIIIPEGVIKIDQDAFVDCVKLTRVTIPSSVTSICGPVFGGCNRIEELKVAPGNTKYYSENNTIIETSTNALIQGCKGTEIPSSVTSIGDHAFSGHRELERIYIPKSVTSIGAYAFANCVGATTIEFEENSQLTTIGTYAFTNSGITSITIPKGVTDIGSLAFYMCGSLAEINVENGNPRFDSRNNCNAIIETSTNTIMFGCKASKVPEDVTIIGQGAFHGCYSLTSIVIPEGVTSIATTAFAGTGLTSIIIPSSVQDIGAYAFQSCYQLTSIEFEEDSKLKYIGAYAFSYGGLTTITIPESVTHIAAWAFHGCNSLSTIEFADTKTWWKVEDNGDWNNSVGGTSRDVANPTTNARWFSTMDEYCNYYWYKT